MPFRSSLSLAAIGVVLVLSGCSGEEPAPVARPVLVESPRPLGEGGDEVYPGAVRAEVETELSFRIPGKISRRLVEAGTQVTAGQVLATLDPEDANLNLDAAKAEHALALADARRARDMKARGYVSQSQVDTAESRLKLANAKLSLAENQSRYTELRADSEGVVTAVIAEAGETVTAGRPVFRFAAGTAREVLINVPEGRIQDVRNAQNIGVTLWTVAGKTYGGKVRVASPQADPQTRTHEVRISIADVDAAVQLGATATVLIGGKGGANTFRLPATSIGDDGRQHARVWVVKGDPAAAQPVSVQVLQYLHDSVMVSGDLEPEDKVITAGVHLLTPGMPVLPIPRSAPAAL
jgi:membrane fusion protein, multidrug efflux system